MRCWQVDAAGRKVLAMRTHPFGKGLLHHLNNITSHIQLLDSGPELALDQLLASPEG